MQTHSFRKEVKTLFESNCISFSCLTYNQMVICVLDSSTREDWINRVPNCIVLPYELLENVSHNNEQIGGH